MLLRVMVTHLGGKTIFNTDIDNPTRLIVYLKEGNKITFKPEDIRGFDIPSMNDYYISRFISIDVSPFTLDGLEFQGNKDTVIYKWVFLRTVVKGKVNLLSFIDSVDKRHFYIENGDSVTELNVYYSLSDPDQLSGTTLLEQDAFKTQMLNALGDCPDISDKISNCIYTEASLSKVVAFYDSQDHDSSYHIWMKENKIKFHAGILFGLSVNSESISGNGFDGANTFGQGIVGLSGEIVFQRSFSVLIDLRYVRYSINLNDYSNNIEDQSSSAFYDVGYLMLDVLGRYRIPIDNNFLAFFEGGLGNGIYLNAPSNYTTFYYSDGSDPSNSSPFVNPASYQLLITAGIGIEIYNHVELDFRYSRGTGTTNEFSYKSSAVDYALGIGFSL